MRVDHEEQKLYCPFKYLVKEFVWILTRSSSSGPWVRVNHEEQKLLLPIRISTVKEFVRISDSFKFFRTLYLFDIPLIFHCDLKMNIIQFELMMNVISESPPWRFSLNSSLLKFELVKNPSSSHQDNIYTDRIHANSMNSCHDHELIVMSRMKFEKKGQILNHSVGIWNHLCQENFACYFFEFWTKINSVWFFLGDRRAQLQRAIRLAM